MYRNSKDMSSRRNAECGKRLFDLWFSANYEMLRNRCISTNVFGEIFNTNYEDVFHDAYLVARDSINNEDSEIFLHVFLAAFKRQSKIKYQAEQKEIRPKDLFWSLLKVDEDLEPLEIEEKLAKREKFVNQVKRHARNWFNAEDYEIFNLYFIHSYTLENVSVMLNKSVSHIWGRVHYTQTALCYKFQTI